MPMIPQNPAEERDMALAWSLWRLTHIVKDILEKMPEPKFTADFKRLAEHRQTISKIDDKLHIYFLGD
ncbi:MAG TPA: hypothetical protein VLJ17_15125 [Xanthobacteraceae bacterium]|nr:hypothetical protein [Xanthobacteraceae bacterium]